MMDSTDSDIKTRVLLVDDNDDIREVIGVGLDMLGLQIAKAATGKEAIEQFSLFRPDVMIVDQGLPDMPGIEVGRQVRTMDSSESGTEVILALLTGTDGQTLREMASQTGFAGFFVKPIKIQTIFEWIQERCQGPF